MPVLVLRINPVTGVITALNIQDTVGGFASVDVGKQVLGLHDVRLVEGAFYARGLLVALVVVQLWVLVKL
jgi:hypothetical protein